MSKAFTRESDDAPERPQLIRPSGGLPPGAKNYMTADGISRLRAELENLTAQPDSSAIRQRVCEIQDTLQTAISAPVPPEPWNQVLFGAYVTVREHDSIPGDTITYRIVGSGETDLDSNWVSWLSPLAKAVLKARIGDTVRFRSPGGEQRLEISSIRY